MSINLKKCHHKKTGLVLSGGVVKAAAWHLGVVMALEDLGYKVKHNKSSPKDLEHPLIIDMMVGSSAGSMTAAMLTSGLPARDIMKASLGLEKFPIKPVRYTDMFSLNKKFFTGYGQKNEYQELSQYPGFLSKIFKPFTKPAGFFTTDGLKNYLVNNILESDKFDDFKAELFIVATQLDNSKKIIFTKAGLEAKNHPEHVHYRVSESVSEAVAASMSLPPFFAPYPLTHPVTGKTDYYIDGEIRETLSTHVAEDQNCDVIISSWTHTPYKFNDTIGSLVHYGLPSIAIQSIYLMIEKKIETARNHKNKLEKVYKEIATELKNSSIETKSKRKILKTLEVEFNFKKNRTYIDIFPDPDDAKMFFINSFSLNNKHTSYVIKAAYRRTMEIFS